MHPAAERLLSIAHFFWTFSTSADVSSDCFSRSFLFRFSLTFLVPKIHQNQFSLTFCPDVEVGNPTRYIASPPVFPDSSAKSVLNGFQNECSQLCFHKKSTKEPNPTSNGSSSHWDIQVSRKIPSEPDHNVSCSPNRTRMVSPTHNQANKHCLTRRHKDIRKPQTAHAVWYTSGRESMSMFMPILCLSIMGLARHVPASSCLVASQDHQTPAWCSLLNLLRAANTHFLVDQIGGPPENLLTSAIAFLPATQKSPLQLKIFTHKISWKPFSKHNDSSAQSKLQVILSFLCRLTQQNVLYLAKGHLKAIAVWWEHYTCSTRESLGSHSVACFTICSPSTLNTFPSFWHSIYVVTHRPPPPLSLRGNHSQNSGIYWPATFNMQEQACLYAVKPTM